MAPIAHLTIVVSGNTAPVNLAFQDLIKQVTNLGGSFGGVSSRAVAMGNVVSATFIKIAKEAWELTKVLAGIGWNVFTKAVDASVKMNNSLIGLNTTAQAFGLSADKVNGALQDLTRQGLLPIGDAAASMRNLIAMGFDLKQTTEIISALTDSAVYLREEHRNVGQAVRSTTEGLRSMRSAASDNAGMTTNLSQILAAYGYKMQDVADAEKKAGALAALHAGILRETIGQRGLAAASLKTYSGALAALDAVQINLLATMGDTFTRNKAVMIGINYLAEAMRALEGWFFRNKQTISDYVTTGLVFLVRVLEEVVWAFGGIVKVLYTIDTRIKQVIRGWAEGIKEMVTALPMEWLGRMNDMGKAVALGLPGVRDMITLEQSLNGVIRKSTQDINSNNVAAAAWDASIVAAGQSLFRLGNRMEASKGSMLEFPTNMARVTTETTKGGKAAEKAAKQWKKFLEWWEKGPVTIREGMTGAGPGEHFSAKQLLPEWYKLAEVIADIKINIKEGLTSLPGTHISGATMKRWAYQTFYHPVEETFRDLRAALPNIILDALSADSLGGAVAGAASTIGGIFMKNFNEAVQNRIKNGVPLTKGMEAIGYAGAGLEAFAGGYGLGTSKGRVVGALGGAASGALSGAAVGTMIAPGIGTAIGAVVGGAAGLFGGLIGGGKKAAEERKALAEAKTALAQQYGGMLKLKNLAYDLGVNIQAAFDAKKAEDFDRAVKKLNVALEEQKNRLAAIAKATEGVNARAEAFFEPFRASFEAMQEAKDALERETGTRDRRLALAQKTGGDDYDIAKQAKIIEDSQAKIAEIAQRAQPAFERLGLMIRDTFAASIRESGDAISAMKGLEPAFTVLQRGVEELGLTNSAVTEELLANWKLVNDEGLKPLFDAIVADGQILRGLFDAKALTPEGFNAIAEDITASIAGIVEQGGDMQRTLALSQPTLQALWEAQQRFGTITDESTLALLDQAAAQGLVGQHMKETNKQILDVLILIGDALGAKIPDAFRGLKAPAEQAATDVQHAFDRIEVPPIKIRTIWEGPGPGEVPSYGTGGIVTRPTLALVGESGPEAIVPLTGAQLGVSGNTYVTDVYLDGDKIARSTAKKLPRVLRGMGV
jgi:hypothetical protein